MVIEIEWKRLNIGITMIANDSFYKHFDFFLNNLFFLKKLRNLKKHKFALHIFETVRDRAKRTKFGDNLNNCQWSQQSIFQHFENFKINRKFQNKIKISININFRNDHSTTYLILAEYFFKLSFWLHICANFI